MTLDGEFAEAQRLIAEIEAFGKSASDAKLAKLRHAATETCLYREAIRRVAQTIIDALDADAGPVTVEKIERRRREMN